MSFFFKKIYDAIKKKEKRKITKQTFLEVDQAIFISQIKYTDEYLIKILDTIRKLLGLHNKVNQLLIYNRRLLSCNLQVHMKNLVPILVLAQYASSALSKLEVSRNLRKSSEISQIKITKSRTITNVASIQ